MIAKRFMINRLSILVFILLSDFCYSQIDYSEDWVNSGWEYRNDNDSILDVSDKIITEKDLSYLLKSSYPNNNKDKEVIPIYGLLGENFDKIEFVFTEISKSEIDATQYIITGKTKLHETINNFKGKVTFKNAKAHVPKNKEEQTIIVLIGTYTFTETTNEKTAATYTGKLKMILSTTNISEDSLQINMDMVDEDGAVRGFVGVRKTNENNSSQSCIWGFTRFPHQYANRFDIGAGEEVINLKYAKPWFNYSETAWNRILKGQNKTVYLYTDQEDKGISTSEEAYMKPEDATWFYLDSKELENEVVKQLRIDENNIRFITSKEGTTHRNETVVVIGEVEYDASEETEGDDAYGLISHVLLVHSVTGKIKHHFSETSKENGWTSDAIYITDISVETTNFFLTKNEVAFGVKTTFRSGSQSNPYRFTTLSLYIEDDNSIKKVLDNLTVEEYSGVVNVNTNACYADIKNEAKEFLVLASSTNGYFDIQVKNTIYTSVFERDATGECEPVEKSKVEKISTLRYNNAQYE